MIPAALTYAFALGLVAAVNPCGFPMLPAYLSFFLGPSAAGEGMTRRVGRALRSAIFVSLGFAIVFGVLGVLLRAGVTAFMTWVPWVMVVVGAGLAALGVAGLVGRHPGLRLPLRAWGASGASGQGARSTVAFGVSYAVASLTCSLPIFLVGVTGSFTRSGVVTGIGTFLAYAAGMAVVLAVVSVAVAVARTSVVTVLRQAGRVADRIGPALLVLAGAYLVYYWVEFLIGSSGTGVINTVEGFQSTLTAFLSGARPELVLGILVIVMLAAGLGLAMRSSSGGGTRLRRPRPGRGAEGGEPSSMVDETGRGEAVPSGVNGASPDQGSPDLAGDMPLTARSR